MTSTERVQPLERYQLKFYEFKSDQNKWLHLKRFADNYDWYWTANHMQASTFTEVECNQFLNDIAKTDSNLAKGLKQLCYQVEIAD